MLALVAAPHLAMAQTQTRTLPVRVAAAQQPLPDAQQLLDNLFAPYEAAQTFRGKFDIAVEGERNLIAEIHLDAQFRTDGQGNLSGQKTVMQVVGRGKPKTSQTFVFVDEGATQKIVMVEQKAWWIVPQRDNASALATFVKPLLEQVVIGLENDDKFVPVVSRSKDAGRSVLILKAKKGNAFRAVLDEQTRAIRSLRVKDSISIDASNQVFNEPLSDETLAWNAPADYRQVAPGEVAPPASLGIGVPGLAVENQVPN